MLSINKQLAFSENFAKLKEIVGINTVLPNRHIIEDSLEVQFLPMKLVEEITGKISLRETRLYGEVKKGYTPFVDGDILFAKVTPCMENGKIAIANNLKNGIGFGSSEFHVLRPKSNLLAKYLFFFLIQEKFRAEAQKSMTGAVGLRRVPKKFLEDYEIPLPPLPEQHRIVARLEELFSELDASVAALKKAKEQIKAYKQSVLKYAFEGSLGIDKEELKIDNETGLPVGWKWVKLSDFVFQVKDGTHDTPKYLESGIPFITQKNITRNGLSLEDTKYISVEDHEKFYKRSNVFLNDILISMIGANRGMSCIVNTGTTFSIKNVGLIKPNKNNNTKYLDYYFKSPIGQSLILKESKGGAQQFIGLTELRNWQVIACTLQEQEQIVSEIESRFSEVDNLEKTIDQGLQQAESLRQSILKQAFEGRLVPHESEIEEVKNAG